MLWRIDGKSGTHEKKRGLGFESYAPDARRFCVTNRMTCAGLFLDLKYFLKIFGTSCLLKEVSTLTKSLNSSSVPVGNSVLKAVPNQYSTN